MTVSAEILPLPEDRPTPLYWRQALLALLPLALAGLLPLWTCFTLCGVTLLGLRFPAWGALRLPVMLLPLGFATLFALPGVLGLSGDAQIEALVGLALSFFVQLLSVFSLNMGLVMLEEGRRRGVFFALLPGLVAPQWWLLPALLGGLLGRSGPDDRFAARRTPAHRPMWQVTAGACFFLLLAGLLLPQTHLSSAMLAPAQTSATEDRRAPQPPPLETASPGETGKTAQENKRGVPAPFVVEVDDSQIAFPIETILVGGFLLVLASMIALRRMTAPERLPATLPEKLALAGLVLTALLVLGSGLLMQGGGGGGRATDGPLLSGQSLRDLIRVPTPETRRIDGTPLFGTTSWMIVVGLAVLLAVLYVALWRTRPARTRPADLAVAGADPTAPPAPPLHRVRLAYRRAEAALEAAGQVRAASETPALYAQRLGQAFPELAAPTAALTRAYQPVRYGGRVSEDDAESAEQAAAQIAAWQPPLTPQGPKDD